MKILYAIEPDLCIINPDILANFPLDIVLPKYFFTQINHLKNGDFRNATVSANQIINSLKQWEDRYLLFTNNNGGTVYFIDETINYLKIEKEYKNIDNINLLDRYLLSILYLSEIIEAKIVFLTSSAEIIHKCHTLKFDTANNINNLAELSNMEESWLKPEILVNIETNTSNIINKLGIVDDLETETSIQIQWQDIRQIQGESNIKWRDIR